MTGAKPLPPESEWLARVFIREDSFYYETMPADESLTEYVRLNPLTVRIEDAFSGRVLWPEGTKQ